MTAESADISPITIGSDNPNIGLPTGTAVGVVVGTTCADMINKVIIVLFPTARMPHLLDIAVLKYPPL
jgi:hypothetical protein